MMSSSAYKIIALSQLDINNSSKQVLENPRMANAFPRNENVTLLYDFFSNFKVLFLLLEFMFKY